MPRPTATCPATCAAWSRRYGNFSLVSAPMMWQGQGIGTIDIARAPPRPFTDKEIALLRTFADQAVVAIQNARLFNETKEALERQTATAEILKVIAQSPGDVQPVLDAIVASAKRLVDGYSATVWQLDGELLRLTAFTQTGEQAARALQRFSDGLVVGDAFAMDPLRTGLPIQMADVLTDPRATEEHRELARVRGFHAVTNVPLVREGVAIGMISVTRVEAGRVHAPPDRAAADLRRPGRDRDRERAAVQRDQGGAGATDRDGRGVARHQRLADGYAAGVRRHRAERSPAVRPQGGAAHGRRRRASPEGDELRGGRRVPRRGPAAGRPGQPRWPGGAGVPGTAGRRHPGSRCHALRPQERRPARVSRGRFCTARA